MTTCYVCHRPLKDPKSIERGMGDICASHNQKDLELTQRKDFSDVVTSNMPFSQGLLLKRLEDRTAVTNIPHLVTHHSPDGYEFSYNGSGPADLALNVCQVYLNATGYQGRKTKCYDGKCWRMAWTLHQDFKNAFIANAPKNGTIIPFTQIDTWMKDHITMNMLQECAEETESEE